MGPRLAKESLEGNEQLVWIVNPLRRYGKGAQECVTVGTRGETRIRQENCPSIGGRSHETADPLPQSKHGPRQEHLLKRRPSLSRDPFGSGLDQGVRGHGEREPDHRQQLQILSRKINSLPQRVQAEKDYGGRVVPKPREKTVPLPIPALDQVRRSREVSGCSLQETARGEQGEGPSGDPLQDPAQRSREGLGKPGIVRMGEVAEDERSDPVVGKRGWPRLERRLIEPQLAGQRTPLVAHR